ncbi:MAG: hypothetical protein ACO3JL_20515, partial [Myxococcota bacterium]
ASQYRARYGDDDTLEEALGEQALLVGDYDQAVTHFRSVADDAPTGRRALRLSHALLGAGQLTECRALCERLMSTEAAAGIGMLVLDLAENKSSDLEIDLDETTANHELKQWATLLLQGRAREAASIFAENVALVADLFPWLPGFVQRTHSKGQ